jgi:hypothetical protein
MHCVLYKAWTHGRLLPPKDNPFVDWQLLAMESPLAVAVQIRECLQNGDSAKALRGLGELMDALARAEGRE